MFSLGPSSTQLGETKACEAAGQAKPAEAGWFNQKGGGPVEHDCSSQQRGGTV